MTSRVGGVLALIAVAVLAGAMFLPWWDGHPTVDGNDVRLLEVDIGLFGGERCNTGGDGSCTKLPLVGGFKTLEAIEVGALGAAGVLAAAVGALALGRNARRKSIGSVSIATGAAAAIVALVLIVTGPDIHVQQTVVVPTGLGGFIGLAGGLLSLVAAVIARRTDPPATARIPRAVANIKNAPTQATAPMAPLEPTGAAQGFDVHALTANLGPGHDALRPAQVNPEPRIGRAMPPSTTGNLPGPAGPLVPPGQPSAPLFSSAPQLRPLYEMQNAGFVPQPPPPPLPSRAPTPIARAELEEDGAAAAAARKPPPLRRTAPPPPTRPPISPPGSQGAPMTPMTGTRPPPLAGGLMASTAMGIGPLVPPSSTQVTQQPPMPLAMPPPVPMPPPAQPPALPPARPGAQARMPAPPARPLANHVPTPPPLEMPTPEPDSLVSADAVAISGSQLIADEEDELDDDDDDNDDVASEPAFSLQSTFQRDRDEPAENSNGDDNTSPGLGIALEETPAAHLLAPDDIETRGMRKLATRELEEAERAERASTAALSRTSQAVLSSAKRPPPMTPAAPDTDENDAMNDAMDDGMDEAEPTGDTGDPTVDHAPVFGGASSPPKLKTPPPGSLRADTAHAATDLAPAPSLAELKAAHTPSKPPVQIAPKVAPVAVASASVSAQPPPPRSLKTPLPNAGPQPACPQCEAPMSWVEEHLRFYCRSCKMYF